MLTRIFIALIILAFGTSLLIFAKNINLSAREMVMAACIVVAFHSLILRGKKK